MTDLDAGMRDVLANDGRNVATTMPTGEAAVAAIMSDQPVRDSSSSLVVDRLVQQVGIALTDVNASVTRRLDDLQAKIDRIRSKLKIENDAARGRIQNFVQLSTDAMVAAQTIDAALEKLEIAIDQ